MELNKKKAECEFKKGYLVMKGKGIDDAQIVAFNHELAEIFYQISALEKKIAEKHILLFYPNEDKLIELGSELEKFGPEKIYQAIEKKNGIVYEFFEKKGKIIKENFEKRKDIAALVEFVNLLPKNMMFELIKKIKFGEIGELDVSTINEKEKIKLFVLLNRSGITCFLDLEKHVLSSYTKDIKWDEVKVRLNGNYIWINQEKVDEIKRFEKELTKIANLVQFKNAERQIKTFTPDEETQFKDLQIAYLALIRKRNAFLEEEIGKNE